MTSLEMRRARRTCLRPTDQVYLATPGSNDSGTNVLAEVTTLATAARDECSTFARHATQREHHLRDGIERGNMAHDAHGRVPTGPKRK